MHCTAGQPVAHGLFFPLRLKLPLASSYFLMLDCFLSRAIDRRLNLPSYAAINTYPKPWYVGLMESDPPWHTCRSDLRCLYAPWIRSHVRIPFRGWRILLWERQAELFVELCLDFWRKPHGKAQQNSVYFSDDRITSTYHDEHPSTPLAFECGWSRS